MVVSLAVLISPGKTKEQLYRKRSVERKNETRHDLLEVGAKNWKKEIAQRET